MESKRFASQLWRQNLEILQSSNNGASDTRPIVSFVFEKTQAKNKTATPTIASAVPASACQPTFSLKTK